MTVFAAVMLKWKGPVFLTHSVYSVCLRRTGPLKLISHDFINSQSSLIIFGTEIPYSILHWYNKKFVNGLRTDCVVSITTVVTWHTWTADFWADFKQTYHRQGNKRVAKWLWGCVSDDRRHSNTYCNFWYNKILYYSDGDSV